MGGSVSQSVGVCGWVDGWMGCQMDTLHANCSVVTVDLIWCFVTGYIRDI